MDPSLSVWVIDFDPSMAPGLPAVLGERARKDPAGTIYFKVGPLDTDWSLTPGGGVGIVTSVGGTAPIASSGGTTPVISLNDTAVTPGSYTYSSITVDQKGRLTSASNGTTPAPVNATYITQTTNATLTNEQALSSLSSGVMHSVTATGVVSTFAVGSARIPFGSGANGAITDSANLTTDGATVTMASASGGGISIAFTLAGAQNLEKQGSGNFYVGTLGAQLLGFYTTNATRMSIAAGGDVAVLNLAAGGVVYATAATGVLKIGTSSEVAAAITWPTAAQVLVSSGTTTAPVGDTGFTFDTTRHVLCLGGSTGVVGQRLNILGTRTIASDPNVTWDPVYVDPGTLSLTGTLDVTIARGVSPVYILGGTIDGSASINIDTVATVVINSQPSLTGGLTATQKLAFWVKTGDARFDGNFVYAVAVEASSYVNATDVIAQGTGGTRTFEADASTNKIQFFGVTKVNQQAGGAATAGALYTATEQGMLNAAYGALRTYGLLT